MVTKLLARDNPTERATRDFRLAGISDQRFPFKIYDRHFLDKCEPFKGVTGAVCDLGCGQTPFPLANVLVEIDPLGQAGLGYSGTVPGVDRHSTHVVNGVKTYSLADGRILYVLDVERQQLPFGDKSLDYLYTSHVLEHLRNPESTIEEIIRSSKSGCIKFPGRRFELLYGDGISPDGVHKWLMELIDGTLTFRKPTKGEYEFIKWRLATDNKQVFPTHFSPQIAEKYLELEASYDYADIYELFWTDSFNFRVLL